MKRIYVVFQGKNYAVADTIRTGENLIPHIRKYNAEVAHLCESRAEAERIAAEWNKNKTK